MVSHDLGQQNQTHNSWEKCLIKRGRLLGMPAQQWGHARSRSWERTRSAPCAFPAHPRAFPACSPPGRASPGPKADLGRPLAAPGRAAGISGVPLSPRPPCASSCQHHWNTAGPRQLTRVWNSCSDITVQLRVLLSLGTKAEVCI